MPKIMKTQVMDMVREHVNGTFEAESVELEQFEWDTEMWATSENPIEFRKPEDLHGIIEKISSKKWGK